MKLVYEKYKDNDAILKINLHNGYTVIAIKEKLDDGYDVEFRITENSVDKWDLIQEYEHVFFDANYKSINVLILKWVSTKFNSGKFDYYIDRYKFETECFEAGLAEIEAKRIDEYREVWTFV